jgi:hypothetical protein
MQKIILDKRSMSMTIRRKSEVKTVIGAVCLLIHVLSCADVCGSTNVLTFFGWSDQHVKADGDGAHLLPVIDAMNTLSERAFPPSIGGRVDEPDFVIGLGDITEWPTHAAKDTYEQLITGRLRFPSYDVAGNHDSGGSAPSPTIHNWLIKRHGSLSYTFSRKGIHFVALYSKYDESLNSPAQPISKDALEYLRTSLSRVPENAPIVVATHLCFESITNRYELIDAFGDANVILVLGGHYHKASVNRYRGVNFVQLPSPAPGSPSEFTIIRIDSDNRDLILEIKGSVEYGAKARQYGQSWPHLLVEQQVRKTYPLDELAKLHLSLGIRLLYSENRMMREAYSPELHTAQFQMFLVVRNVNEQSKDCGNYYWFGVPFYDSRYDSPPSHKAKDGGKADATGKFIYTVAGECVNAEHLKEHEWAEIDADLLPYIKAGLEEAVKRGYLASSNLGDYGITGINMGWELPGTFDASMQIRDLGILAVLR